MRDEITLKKKDFDRILDGFKGMDDARLGQMLKQGPNFHPTTASEIYAHGLWRGLVRSFDGEQSKHQAASLTLADMAGTGLVEIKPITNRTPQPVKNPLTRSDLFVKGTDIYILDSVKRQTGMKLGAFNVGITKAVKAALNDSDPNTDELMDSLILAFKDFTPASQSPRVTVHVNCPDDQIDARADKILANLAAAKQRGVKLEIDVVGNPDGAWAKILPNVENYVAMPKIKEMLDKNYSNTK